MPRRGRSPPLAASRASSASSASSATCRSAKPRSNGSPWPGTIGPVDEREEGVARSPATRSGSCRRRPAPARSRAGRRRTGPMRRARPRRRRCRCGRGRGSADRAAGRRDRATRTPRTTPSAGSARPRGRRPPRPGYDSMSPARAASPVSAMKSAQRTWPQIGSGAKRALPKAWSQWPCVFTTATRSPGSCRRSSRSSSARRWFARVSMTARPARPRSRRSSGRAPRSGEPRPGRRPRCQTEVTPRPGACRTRGTTCSGRRARTRGRTRCGRGAPARRRGAAYRLQPTATARSPSTANGS